MKKTIIAVFLCLALAAFLALSVSADDLAGGSCGESGSAVTWSLNKATGHLTISGKGSMKNWSKLATTGDTAAPWRAHADLIKTVEVKGVEELGSYAFSTLKSLTSVTLDDTVRTLPTGAFYECTSLVEVKLPSGLTEIGESAFYGCKSLSKLELPATLAKLASDALYGCGGLSEITVASGNTVFAAENNCLIEKTTATLLRGSLDGSIPNSVISIAAGAFSGNAALKTVLIPNSIQTIGRGAYAGCTALESMTLPFIGDRRAALGETDDREKINGRLAFIFGESSIPATLRSIVITDTEVIETEAFANCTSIEELTLPEKLKVIEDGAFFGCVKLSEIKLPSSLTEIGMAAFASCTSITKIELPNSVKAVGETAFLGCTSLTSFTVGASLTELGAGVLYSCPKLESLGVSDDNGVFYSENNCIIKRDGKVVVVGCRSSQLPADVLAIGEGAFRNCNGLTAIALPEGLVSIGDSAFEGCVGLTALEFPSSLTSVGSYAFAECSGLTTVKAHDGIIYGDSAFKNCTSMQSEGMPELERPVEDLGCASVTVIQLVMLISLAAAAFVAVVIKKNK